MLRLTWWPTPLEGAHGQLCYRGEDDLPPEGCLITREQRVINARRSFIPDERLRPAGVGRFFVPPHWPGFLIRLSSPATVKLWLIFYRRTVVEF